MNDSENTVILSAPRSGSSYLAATLARGEEPLVDRDLFPTLQISRSESQFNPRGYRESVGLNLLCDQMIRLRMGNRASFLFNRSEEANDKRSVEFDYDLDERVEIPKDFLRKVRFYTGQTWDVWGLSRMRPGGKWWLAYGHAGVRSGVQVESRWSRFVELLSEPRALVLKDPRLLYLASDLPENTRALVIRREPKALLSSMRAHYGQRLFTEKTFPNFDWVSNHFNYRVVPQDFSEFLHNVEKRIRDVQDTRETLIVTTESLSDEGLRRKVLQFVGHKR